MIITQNTSFLSTFQMIEVDNKYIDSAVDELMQLLGVKERIEYGFLQNMLEEGKAKDCVETIAHTMGLPIGVVISYVPSVYRGTSTPGQGFASQEIVKTVGTGEGRKGVESITAQVSAPSILPLFGSSNLKNYFVTVKVSDNVTKYPMTFMAVMAHELSHILLRTMQHRERDNEVYTDLTSMLLGFNEVVKMGRKVIEQDLGATYATTYTTTYGYLSDSGFDYAYQKIGRVLERNRKTKKAIIQKIKQLRKLLVQVKNGISKFRYYIKVIDNNPRSRISKDDASQIVSLHQPNYVKKFEDFISESETRLQKYRDYKGINHYPHNWHTDIEGELNQITHEVKEVAKLLKKNLSVLKKNMSLPWRFRVMFSVV
jgi:uncharacterized protein YqgV (UPF0045/DUF77 family)